jgi:uncharacterized protein
MPGMEDGGDGSLDAAIRVIVTPDRSEARAVDYTPPGAGGAPLTEERIVEVLREAGVTVAPDAEGVRALLERIAANGSVAGIALARSTPPVDGADGEIQFKVRTGVGIGARGADDRIDYHERGIVESVKAGQVIAVIARPTAGRDGVDVTGGAIPARAGRAAELRVGPGATLSAEGASAVATADGMVQFARGVLGVTDSFEIQGDVDFSTGNVRMERGSVLIRGVVRDGFEVLASGNVVVQKEVEAARIEAGGDVEVRHGILAGKIKAEGAICAQFAVNATLVAGGSVVVANNLYTCDVTAGDKILATSGKGVVRGGVLRCRSGMEANELGSVSESPTEVIVDTDLEEERALAAEIAEVEESVEAVYRNLGSKESLSAMPAAAIDGARAAWEHVNENLKGLLERQTALKDRLWEVRRAKQRELRATVTIRRVAYPGVIVRIGGLSYSPAHPIERCVLYYDLLTDTITSAPL